MSEREMFNLNTGGSFTDGNGRQVEALDVVEYQEGSRRGILLEAMHDGDAFVLFRDTKKAESVRWIQLCKIPLIDEKENGAPEVAAAERERTRCAGLVSAAIQCSYGAESGIAARKESADGLRSVLTVIKAGILDPNQPNPLGMGSKP